MPIVKCPRCKRKVRVRFSEAYSGREEDSACSPECFAVLSGILGVGGTDRSPSNNRAGRRSEDEIDYLGNVVSKKRAGAE